MKPTDITLAVPCYNVTDVLPETLDAVERLDPQPGRVLCVDDGSDDDLSSVLEGYPSVDLVTHRENQGLAAARNTALEHTDTPGLAMIDADVVLEPDWLGNICAAMAAHDAAVVGGCLEERITTTADRWRSVHISQCFGADPKEREWVPGANALYDVDSVESVDGWDVKFRTNHEDVDICTRLREAGYTIRYTPSARAEHNRTDTVSSVLSTAWDWMYRYRNEPDDFSDLPVRYVKHAGRAVLNTRKDFDDDVPHLAGITLLRMLVHMKIDLETVRQKTSAES